MINVDDTTPPVITCPPSQTGLLCLTEALPLATTSAEFISIGGTAADNCSAVDELTVSHVDNPVSPVLLDYCSANPADRTLTRTYTIMDACGNPSTCTQTFTYNQSLNGPVITSVPPNRVVDCAFNVMPELALFDAEAECGVGITTSVGDVVVSGTPNCPGATYRYTYTVTDGCGRMATHVQTYTIQNDGPELLCPTDIICQIECTTSDEEIMAAFEFFAQNASVTTSCSGPAPVITNSFNPDNFIENFSCINNQFAIPNVQRWQNVTFTATDNCGRTSSCTRLVVIVDTKAPVISGVIPKTTRVCDGLATYEYQTWAQNLIDNTLSAVDACDEELTWSYSPNTPNLSCVAGGFAVTDITITATDDCGNSSSVSGEFKLKDAPSFDIVSVQGHIETEANEMVELVDVTAMGAAGMVGTMQTTNDGYYEFSLVAENNYDLEPKRNDNPWNGVSTFDLVMMSRHILGLESLDSPYKMIAADVNNSGTITCLLYTSPSPRD